MTQVSPDIWLAQPAPRYTSYPPATAFHAECTKDTYRASLALASEGEAASLYLHIPFCSSQCLYCGCHQTVTQREDRLEAYLVALKEEMATIAGLLETKRKISRIHLGGGSPGMLSEIMLEELFSALNQYFDLDTCGEIAIELDPRGITPGKAATLSLLGVTRASLGVQDFTPAVQRAIGREQPYEMVENAVRLLRTANIRQISFDLLYGLPKQTPESMIKTAELAVGLKPDRIALYSYAHLPQLKPHQKALEIHGLPDKYATLRLEQAARDVFVKAGYLEIGMDHFSLPHDALAQAQNADKLHRNFQGYTDDASPLLIGLGASAISTTDDGFFQNERDILAYQDSVAQGHLATVRGKRVTGDDRVRATIIETFMCTLSCDIEYVCRMKDYAHGALAAEMHNLKPYIDAGLLVKDGNLWKLNSPHRMAIRVICSVFDTYASTRDNAVSRAA